MTNEALRYESAPARRRRILETLRSSGFVSVSDLARDLYVSDMTIRRDLRKLADDGEARVVRGGVSLPHGPLPALGFTGRATANTEAKRRIGRATASLIGPRDTVAIDAGTTTYALAEALPETFAGSVVTHSVPVIQRMLTRDDIRVIGLGGDLLPRSQAFVGPMTVDAASRLRVRVFFLGAAAVDPGGVYVATDAERPTKLALMDIADEVVVLVDHAKFTTSAPVLLCRFERLAAVVTDRAPPPPVTDALAAAGTRLVVAPPPPDPPGG